MVASHNSDIYPPFQHTLNADAGAQSSESGSVLHSPTHFGASFPPPHGNNFRYRTDHLDVEREQAIVAPQYHYGTALNAQQAPLINTPPDLPSPSPQHAFSVYYPVTPQPRNHIPHDLPVQSLSNSRHPSLQGGGSVDLRYSNISERRLPGEPSHDHFYSRQTKTSSIMLMDGGREVPMSSPSEYGEISSSSPAAGGSREPRREVSTVVIACRQCRGRKIRCDSTRPVCSNCVRRSNACEYDSVPKRRGPDKNPGTRHRRCKRRLPDGPETPTPKRKRPSTDRSSATRDTAPSTSQVKENMASDRPRPQSSRYQERSHDSRLQEQLQHHQGAPVDLRITAEETSPAGHEVSSMPRHLAYPLDQGPYVKSSFPRPLDVNIMRSAPTQHHKFRMPASPTVKHNQKLWWNNFLISYPLRDIERDLTYLFTDTGYWLFFLNLDYFIKMLLDEELRLSIQPAFIYAGLAMATLMKSSELEFKAPGREKALWLRSTAQSYLESSMASGWVDASLAEAALILALFETSAHPMYNPDRVEQALLIVDLLIRSTSLTTIDANDQDVVHYPVGGVPVVHLGPLIDDSPNRKCTCIPPDAPQVPNLFSSWSYIPPWDPTWTDSQIRDEECRRLCWSALSLMCNYVSQCVAFNRDPPEFFLTNSSNYAILFPGEVLDRVSPVYRGSSSPSTKESVWALYCRSMLLWSFTNRMRTSVATNDEKVELIYEAWSEAQSLQDSMEIHDCNLDTALMYMCREYIHNTQITITQMLRRLVPSSTDLQGLGSGPPIFKRQHAEEWLWYQDLVIKAVRSTINHLEGAQGYQLTRRPYQVTWFTNQLSICLVLYDYDRNLKNALLLAKSFLFPVEVMSSLWPCPALQRQVDDLRQRLIEACSVEGIELPMPTNYTLPSL